MFGVITSFFYVFVGSCKENVAPPPSPSPTITTNEAFTKDQTLYLISSMREHLESEAEGLPKTLKELNIRLKKCCGKTLHSNCLLLLLTYLFISINAKLKKSTWVFFFNTHTHTQIWIKGLTGDWGNRFFIVTQWMHNQLWQELKIMSLSSSQI